MTACPHHHITARRLRRLISNLETRSMKVFKTKTVMKVVWAGAAVAAAMASPAALAGNPCPGRNVTFIVPFPPAASSADLISRALATELSKTWDRNVVVDNRPGGGGVPANNMVAKAEPNGCTLALVTSSISINPTLMKGKLPYDTFKDLAPVTQLVPLPQGIFASPNFPANDMPGLLALAKQSKTGITYGSPGVGTSPHLAGAMLNMMTGANFVHIPYNGLVNTKMDLKSGRLDLMFGAIATEVASLKAGEYKLIAVAADKRFEAFPNIATVGETVPGFRLGGFFGVVTSGKTPPAVVEGLAADIHKAMKSPEVQKVLAQLHLTAADTSPAEFARMIRDDFVQLEKVIIESGLDTR